MDRLRKRIDDLDPGEIDRLSVAFRTLLDSNDPAVQYERWVRVHAGCCMHYSQAFLPWHRAYLFEFEDALRSVPTCEDVTLPYWDWTVIRQLPDLVLGAPFLTAMPRIPEVMLELPKWSAVNSLLNDPDYDSFAGHDCPPYSSGGCLESIHSDVHVWIGGVMNTMNAPRDPIFWFHHSYVDRLWSLWQRKFTDRPKCRDLALQGLPGNWTLKDVLDIRSSRLGYDYVDPVLTLVRVLTDAEAAPQRFDAVIPAGTRSIRVLVDQLRLESKGEAPLWLDLLVDGEPFGRIALFGLDHGASHGHDHGIEACTPSDFGVSVCGSLPLSPRQDEPLRSIVLTFMPHWRASSEQRATVAVGRVRVRPQ